MSYIVPGEEHVISALKCALEGFPIIPVAEGGRPLTEHGLKDATTDIVQIAAWWAKWPTAHIGLVYSESVLQALRDNNGSSDLITRTKFLKGWEN